MGCPGLLRVAEVTDGGGFVARDAALDPDEAVARAPACRRPRRVDREHLTEPRGSIPQDWFRAGFPSTPRSISTTSALTLGTSMLTASGSHFGRRWSALGLDVEAPLTLLLGGLAPRGARLRPARARRSRRARRARRPMMPHRTPMRARIHRARRGSRFLTAALRAGRRCRVLVDHPAERRHRERHDALGRRRSIRAGSARRSPTRSGVL